MTIEDSNTDMLNYQFARAKRQGTNRLASRSMNQELGMALEW